MSLETIRRLERLPHGIEARRFILTPKDQDRLDELLEPRRAVLSERETSLWDTWEASTRGPRLRAFLQELRSREFSEREISHWRRWMMSPFVAHGSMAIVSLQWSEMRRRDRDRYLDLTLRCVQEMLSRRAPAVVRLLEVAAQLDETELTAAMARMLGFSQPSATEMGQQALALIDDTMAKCLRTSEELADIELADQKWRGVDGA